MDKVAYLAMTYSDFTKPQIMKRFFNEEDKDLYNLYLHSKYELYQKYFRKFIIDSSLIIDTGWGYYSLVQATCILLKEALKDPDNKRFILISDSHIPLYSMKTMHQKLFERPALTFSPMREWVVADLFNHVWAEKGPPPGFVIGNGRHVAQWFTCGRDDAEFFIQKEEEYRDYFPQDKQIFTDELWFGLMAKSFNRPFVYMDTCHVSWEETPKSLMKLGARNKPKTYKYLSNKMVDEFRNQGFLFFRKVHPFTDIEDEYYLLEK